MVTIFGRNFSRRPNENIVRFSGVQAQVIGGIGTQNLPFIGSVAVILTRVPQGAVTGDLTVEVGGRVSNAKNFEVPGTQPGGNNGGNVGGGNPGGNAGNVIWAEGLEGQQLTLTQQGNVWEAGAPRAGPRAAIEGQFCAGTAMQAGQYGSNANAFLISPLIDLSRVQAAQLTFKHWFDTEQGYDGGRVLVTPDNGANYYLVRPQGGYGAQVSVFGQQLPDGFSGRSAGWEEEVFDLSAFAGQQVYVVWQFASDQDTESTGWYVDDIRVTAP